MEVESKVITKPDRPPDVVIRPGHAIWWPEMVFLHVYGDVHKIKIDQENGSLYYILDSNKSRHVLPDEFKKAYDKWWYEPFEAAFLGEEE
jgi:hypothetical protein